MAEPCPSKSHVSRESGENMNVHVLSEAEKIELRTATHPCFHCGASENARIHLPIAPECNIQCNYCVRKFDCVNESRPGVVSAVLSPEQAVERFRKVKETVPNLTVVGIAGPGDPLANFDQVKEALQQIRAIDPNITFCLSTNGLMLPFYMNHMISLGITHVTVTVNTIDSKTGAKIYSHVRYLGKKYTGEEGAALLLQNQLSGIRYLSSMGVVVKVNIVLLKGINEDEIEEIVYTVKDCGCGITNIMQLIPVAGSSFESLGTMSNAELYHIRKSCESMLPQMYHCKQCRADAIGTLGHDISLNFMERDKTAGGKSKKKNALSGQYRFAVCSKDGTLIDQHFGHAERFLIYDYDDGEISLAETRAVDSYCSGPENGEDEEKIKATVNMLSDCSAVLCMRIGYYPSQFLKNKGIQVITTYHRIEDGIKEAAAQLRTGVPSQAIHGAVAK